MDERTKSFGLQLPANATVKDVIDALSSCPMDACVVMSRDEEGNGYYGVAQVDVNVPMATAKGSWGNTVYQPLDGEFKRLPAGGKRVVILWPY